MSRQCSPLGQSLLNCREYLVNHTLTCAHPPWFGDRTGWLPKLGARLPSLSAMAGMNAQNLFLVIAGANAISLVVFVAPRLLVRIRLWVIAVAWGRSDGKPPAEPL
jgi:hypothetical protein